jgi:hypothetical protein
VTKYAAVFKGIAYRLVIIHIKTKVMKNFIYVFVAFIFLNSCSNNDPRIIDDTYNPDMSLTKFSNPTNITNPYFLFELGKTYVYEGKTDEGIETFEHIISSQTKTVLGINCVVLDVKEWVNGKLVEHTYDWFAQDNEGNVWYMGEYVDNYDNNGKIVNHSGSWEAGIDGAKAGITMFAKPVKGLKYRLEYYFNEAEDEAEIIATDVTVTVPLGTFKNCLQTRDFTALEPDAQEYKYYAPGIGLIKEYNIEDKTEASLKEIR